MVDLIFKKWSKAVSFLRFLCEIEPHFANLVLKKWSEPALFFRFLCEIELSLQSRAHFVNLILKKWSEPAEPVSFLRFLCEIELSLQSRAHFVDHFPDRGAHLRKQTPSGGDHGQPLYPKKHKVLRPRVFSAARASQVLDDDVINSVSRALCRPHGRPHFKNWSEPVRSVSLLRFLCDQLLDDDVVALAAVARTLCRPHGQPHLEKVVRTGQFFYDFYVKSSSRYRLVHILSTSSWKSGPNRSVFWRCLCEIELSLQSREYFVDLTLRFLCEIELSLQSRAHFVNLILKKWSDPVSF